MNTKHTAGPWSASNDCWPWEIDDSSGASIAVIEEMFRMGNKDENEANARLIAAAPELLESAQEGLAVGKALMNIMKEMDAADFIRAEMWLEQLGVQKGFGKRIMDSIAKATGKEPA